MVVIQPLRHINCKLTFKIVNTFFHQRIISSFSLSENLKGILF